MRPSAFALAVALGGLGCKDKHPSPAPPVTVTPSSLPAGSAAASPSSAQAPRPTLPADVQKAPPGPMSVDDARAALPTIEGTVILDLKQTSDQKQVHITWCIDGDSAQGVAKQVGQWMAEAGYTGMSIRGDDRKAGVSGDRASIRMSMIVSASGAANCAAPQHYFASATLFHP